MNSLTLTDQTTGQCHRPAGGRAWRHRFPTAVCLACVLLALCLSACQFQLLRPHIILIALERTRVDRIGAYGREPSPTQLLDFLARTGVRFTNAYTPFPGGHDSTHALLSGQVPAGTDSETKGLFLAERLQKEGYLTIASLNERGAQDPDLRRGFSEIDDAGGTPEERSARLAEFIQSHVMDEQPMFVFYQAPLIRAPYENAIERSSEGDIRPMPIDIEPLKAKLEAGDSLDDTERTQIGNLYNGELRRANNALFEFMGPIRDWGFYDRYLTVVTAVGGEELGERGRYSPEGSLYDEMLRVPLILMGHKIATRGARDELVRTTDIAPTILEYAGVQPPAPLQGRDLLQPELPLLDSLQSRHEDMRAVRTSEWKLIRKGEEDAVELYDLVAEPEESTNVAAENPDIVEMLMAKMTD